MEQGREGRDKEGEIRRLASEINSNLSLQPNNLSHMLETIQNIRSQLDCLESYVRSIQGNSNPQGEKRASFESNASSDTQINQNNDKSLTASEQFYEFLGASIKTVNRTDLLEKLNELPSLDAALEGFSINEKMNQSAEKQNLAYLLMEEDDVKRFNKFLSEVHDAFELQNCLKHYWRRRCNRWIKNLESIGIKEYSQQALEKLEWKELESLIYTWTENMNIFVRILIPAEKILFENIFFGLKFDYSSFSGIIYQKIVKSLHEGELMIRIKKGSQAAPSILSVYDCVYKLRSRIEFFTQLGGYRSSKELNLFLDRASSTIREIFTDFSMLIRKQNLSGQKFAPEAKHEPITSYVMNYIVHLKEEGYLNILSLILGDVSSEEDKKQTNQLQSPLIKLEKRRNPLSPNDNLDVGDIFHQGTQCGSPNLNQQEASLNPFIDSDRLDAIFLSGSFNPHQVYPYPDHSSPHKQSGAISRGPLFSSNKVSDLSQELVMPPREYSPMEQQQKSYTSSETSTPASKVQLSLSQSASWILLLLQSLLHNLNEKSRLIQDRYTRILFMINNVQYIWSKIENSTLKDIILDEYTWRLKEYVSGKCRELESSTLEQFGIFFEDGKNNPDNVKAKIKAFDQGMKFLDQKSGSFFISDAELRFYEISYFEKLIVTAYKNFIQAQTKIFSEKKLDKLGVWELNDIRNIIRRCFPDDKTKTGSTQKY